MDIWLFFEGNRALDSRRSRQTRIRITKAQANFFVCPQTFDFIYLHSSLEAGFPFVLFLTIRTIEGDIFCQKIDWRDFFEQRPLLTGFPTAELRGHHGTSPISDVYRHFNGSLLCSMDSQQEAIFWRINDSALQLSSIPLSFLCRTTIEGYILGWLKGNTTLVVQAQSDIFLCLFKSDKGSLEIDDSPFHRVLLGDSSCCEHRLFFSSRLDRDGQEILAFFCIIHGTLLTYAQGNVSR
jgi:hypothetical protein